MCGIAGIYSLAGRPIEPFDIVRMCDAQTHRGPDDAGYVLLAPLAEGHKPSWWEVTPDDRSRSTPDLQTEGVGYSRSAREQSAYQLGFGHRRLSVLDLSAAGHQPMANREKTVWITYNGEIYNYLELKKDLTRKGYEFVSTTDTEVILYLYQEYGADFVERLNGMFAFAVWDDLRGTLLLARDRYGIKPLYYTEWRGALYFASEVKAFLALKEFPRAVNHQALIDYFTFQNTFGEATLFDGVHLLDAGHCLSVQNRVIRRRRYWDFNFSQIDDLGEAQAKERLGFLLEDTIQRQLMSDVPVGAYLSGGMDSGSITALASARVPRLMTFTGGFDLTNVSGFEAAFDERHDAEMLSAQFKTEHYEMVFHAGDMEWALPRVIWSIEDLRAGMCYPYYYTARLASRFVKVVLAGTGGDEVFAGYPWRYRVAAEGSPRGSDFLGRYFGYWNRLVPCTEHEAFFSPDVTKSAGGHRPFDSFAGIVNQQSPVDDPLRRALYFEAKTFLHGLLVIEDKLSMAHSLESRVPLLDHAVVDFVSTLPTRYLINHQWDKNPQRDENLSGKYLFRRAMEGILPDAILLKRKQGFSAPDQSWYQGPLMGYIKSILLDRRTEARGFFQQAFIQRVLDEHLSGAVNHRLLIWSLLSFELWNRLFMDADRVSMHLGTLRR